MKILGFVYAIFICSFQVQPDEKENSGKQTHQNFKDTVPLNYLLYLPENYDKNRTEGYPAILFLHGAGERGNDLDILTHWGPPRIAKEKGLPFIVISPQCPKDHWWTSMMYPLKSLLDFSIKTNKIV